MDDVLGRVARRQEEDRHAGPRSGEAARDLEAVDVGQHHVEHDDRGLASGDRGDRVGAVCRRLDLEALEAERHRDHVDDVRLIVDNEHAELLGFLHGRIIAPKPVCFLRRE